MIDKTTLLEAHVRFELNRWDDGGLAKATESEVAALAAWLGSLTLVQVATPEQVTDWIQRYAVEMPLTDELVQIIDEGVRGVYAALLQEEISLRELVPRTNYAQFIEAVLRMPDVRQTITAQVTSSSIYSGLVSHLLYRGIKSFVLKENVLARRVPGASSLLRLGQSAMSSSAPGLEKGIDKQLLAFINANIQETTRESYHYLQDVLDDANVWKAADEVWATRFGETVADNVGLLDGDSLDELVVAGRNVWLHLRQTPFFHRMTAVVVADFFARHGTQTVTATLADLGLRMDGVVAEVTAAVTPLLVRAREDGFLEQHIRGRLDAFYSAYFADSGAQTTTRKRAPAKAPARRPARAPARTPARPKRAGGSTPPEQPPERAS